MVDVAGCRASYCLGIPGFHVYAYLSMIFISSFTLLMSIVQLDKRITECMKHLMSYPFPRLLISYSAITSLKISTFTQKASDKQILSILYSTTSHHSTTSPSPLSPDNTSYHPFPTHPNQILDSEKTKTSDSQATR